MRAAAAGQAARVERWAERGAGIALVAVGAPGSLALRRATLDPARAAPAPSRPLRARDGLGTRTGCPPTPGAAVSYDGATTIGLQLLPDLAPLCERLGFRFGAIGDRGTNRGLEAARAGQVDVAGVMRELTAAEKAELRWELIGYDALGIFVCERLPVRGLSRAQAKAIFTGRVGSWKEVGGPDLAVLPVTEFKAGGRGTVLELRRLLLDGEEYGPTREREDAPDCLRDVAADPAAVTAASMSMAIPGVRAVAIDGAAPTAANVRGGTYALGRPMYLVARRPAVATVEALLALLRSPEGQAVVGRKFTPAR